MELFTNKRRAIENIIRVLNKGNLSEEGYNSCQRPFFHNDSNKKSFEIEYNISNIKIPEGINRNILLIYNILGNSKKEIYLNDWTIFSLENAIEYYNEYCKHGQTKIFNVAYRYAGMGHIEVLSCDLDSHLLFYRMDGGSNGWDREANFKSVIKNGSKDYKKFFFRKWWDNIFPKE